MKDYRDILKEMEDEDNKAPASSKKPILIISVIVVLLAVGVSGFVYLKNSREKPAANGNLILSPADNAKQLAPSDNAPKENTQVYDLFKQTSDSPNNQAQVAQQPALQAPAPEPALADTDKKITQADLERELELQKKMLAQQKFGEDKQKLLDEINNKPAQNAPAASNKKLLTNEDLNAVAPKIQELSQLKAIAPKETKQADVMMDNAKNPPTAQVLEQANSQANQKDKKKKPELANEVVNNQTPLKKEEPAKPQMAAKKPEKMEKPSAKIATGGNWRVQFASLTSPTEADKRWNSGIKPKIASKLGGLRLQIERALVGDTTRYRIQAVGFKNSQAAREFCNFAIGQGLECIPIKP